MTWPSFFIYDVNISTMFSREIYISTNYTCNLRCIYCFERYKNDFSFDPDKAVHKLKKILSTKTEHGTCIKLLGGEPFIIFDKIKKLCETMWSLNLEEKFTFYTATNGTLVHGDIQDWLSCNKDRFIVKLSLDGDKKSQEINRPNSFDRIDIRFFVETWKDLRINMTITPQTLPFFYENIRFFHSAGINNIQTNFALMTDWSDKNLEQLFFKELLKAAKFYLENPTVSPCYIFRTKIELILLETFGSPLCGIGSKKAYDFDTEKYYPCHLFFPSVCGTIPEDVRKKDYSHREEYESRSCLKCPFINICRTCYAENYSIRGSISERDMQLCAYQKIVFVAVCKYEYARIINLTEPTETDIQKMEAVKKMLPDLIKIENSILNKCS